MLLAQATQPASTLWTPGEVMALMSVFSTVVVAAIAGGIVKVIEANKNARLAIIAAQSAQVKATEAKTTSEHNAQQMKDVRGELFQVALASPAPPSRPSPLVPANFTDTQIQNEQQNPGQEG